MTLTVRSANVPGATTKKSALTHEEMDANWAHVAAITTDLAASTGSAGVGFLPSGTGATADPSSVQGALTRLFSLVPMTGLTFFDSFSRGDTSNGDLGTSESGHVWDLRGAYAGSYPLPAATGGKITDGIFVLDPAVSTVTYATYTMRDTVTRIGARISWTSDSGADASTFAMSMGANANFIDTMVHCTMTRSTWKVQTRNAGGAFTDVVTGSFSGGLAADGTLHTFEVMIHNDTVIVNADGTMSSAYDSTGVLSSVAGKYIFFEHFYNSSSASDRLRIHSVWAGSSPIGLYNGNVHSSNQLTTIYGSTAVNIPDGAFNVTGTDSVLGTLTVLSKSTATGGFRRARTRWLDHLGTSGWIAENGGDGSNNLKWSHLLANSSQTVLQFWRQGLGFANIQNSITAFATGGQASATALTGQLCRVTTCATNGDSVKLPAASGTGLAILVINDGAASCDVFPATGGAIDAVGTNNARAVAAGSRIWFYDIASNVWSSDD